MGYRVRGLSAAPFRHLYGMPDGVLAAHGARRCVVDGKPGFPDRVELRDMEPGQMALLVHYEHQAADTPYRASHAVFVREGAEETAEVHDALPEPLRLRLLSLRAFDAAGMMVDAEIVEGAAAEPEVVRMLGNADVAYIHAHYARRGCYAARIERT